MEVNNTMVGSILSKNGLIKQWLRAKSNKETTHEKYLIAMQLFDLTKKTLEELIDEAESESESIKKMRSRKIKKI